MCLGRRRDDNFKPLTSFKSNMDENISHKENANRIRAEVLSSAIELEDSLTDALSYLYVPKNQEYYRYNLVSDILSELTFDKKIRLFKKFVNIYPEFFSEYPVIRELNKIREIRNQLAHRASHSQSPFDIEPLDSNRIDFLKTGKDKFEFSIDNLEEYIKNCKFFSFYIYGGVNKITNPRL